MKKIVLFFAIGLRLALVYVMGAKYIIILYIVDWIALSSQGTNESCKLIRGANLAPFPRVTSLFRMIRIFKVCLKKDFF